MKAQLALALCLAALIAGGCSKKSDPSPEPNRARHMVLTWTLEGATPVHLKISQFKSATDRTVTATPVDEDKSASGSWDITAAPASFGGLASFVYATQPPAGNRVHIVVTQDGQVLPGQDIWVGTGIPDTGMGTSVRGRDVSLSPDPNR